MSTVAETGLIDALLLDGKGGAKRLDWAAVHAWTPADGVLWLHVDYTVPDATAWLREQIEAVNLEAVVDTDPRPRTLASGDALMLLMRGINHNRASEPEDMISIRMWITPGRVITMRHRGSTSLDSLVLDTQRGKGPRDLGEVVTQLVDRVVDHCVTRVDQIHDSIAGVEEILISERRGADVRSTLADLRRRAIALRRFLGPQRDALARLHALELPWLVDRHRAEITESTDRMMRAIEELDAARDRAAVTQEELASRQSELSNQRLYLLSIITAIFMPLGFVCALLGVNVGGIPFMHDNWAFWVLCAIFAVGVAIQLYVFRRRGWWKRD